LQTLNIVNAITQPSWEQARSVLVRRDSIDQRRLFRVLNWSLNSWSMNPCPCGFYGDTARECRYMPGIVQRYLSKISGPLLDRIDIHTEVPAVAYKDLRGRDDGVCSAEIRERVVGRTTAF